MAQQEQERGQELEVEQASQLPVAGLGVDIVEIERMERVLERTPRFKERVFTEGERAYCERSHRPAAHYATHFAAKEAVSKALGTGFSLGIGLTDIEVAHDERRRPVALLHGAAERIAQEQGVLEVRISLSRTHGTAVANAIAITRETQPKREEKPSRRDDIAAAFKELRGMLDEMDAGGEEAEEPLHALGAGADAAAAGEAAAGASAAETAAAEVTADAGTPFAADADASAFAPEAAAQAEGTAATKAGADA